MKNFFDSLFFPEERHKRGPDPGPYTTYRSYKPHLKQEFRRKCVYCRISDGIKGDEGFGVDHYQPKSKFSRLTVKWSNLFYTCNVCNTWKGEFVSTPCLFLPNPCKHPMARHLQYLDNEVKTYTQHGKWLAELLHLQERRKLRDLIVSSLYQNLETRNELRRDLSSLEARLDQGKGEAESLKAEIQQILEELETVNSRIEILTGEPVPSVHADGSES